MTTENTYTFFFGSNGCLSLAGYRAVISGEISGEPLDKVNAHLESCELCRETLEGLRQNPDDKNVIAGVASLVEKINPSKTVIRPLYYAISAAAVLLFAVGLGYNAYVGGEEKEMDKAFANEFKPYPAPPSEESKNLEGGIVLNEPDTKSPLEKQSGIENKNDVENTVFDTETRAPEKLSADDFKEEISNGSEMEDVQITDNANEIDNQFSAPASTGQTKNVSHSEIHNAPVSATVESVKKTEKRDNYDEAVSYDSKNLEEVVVTSKSKKNQKSESENKRPQSVPAPFEDGNAGKPKMGYRMTDSIIVSNLAMDHYKKGEFSSAAKLFDEILSADPLKSEARFYGGVSWLETGNEKKAENYFRTLIASNDPAFSYPAKWYLSLALIKEKKKAEALQLLDELSVAPGEYQQRAKELAASLR